jgi:hypothetical protein
VGAIIWTLSISIVLFFLLFFSVVTEPGGFESVNKPVLAVIIMTLLLLTGYHMTFGKAGKRVLSRKDVFINIAFIGAILIVQVAGLVLNNQ